MLELDAFEADEWGGIDESETGSRYDRAPRHAERTRARREMLKTSLQVPEGRFEG
jgi:hypothetical protein